MKGDQFGSGAIDFSYLLDAPAGKHGFVKVKDGHFYFENGIRIRFFGVNLVFGAAMPDKEMAVIIAERLARSGINMVRFHHVDSYQIGKNTNTLIDYSEGHSQKIHEENFDRLDFLVSELKKRGIYLHIDLFTLRQYLPGDNLDYDDPLGGALKHVNYYNRRIIDLHKKFIMQYLTHKNPYTGLRYVDEPAVAIVQLLNENGIFWENREAEMPSYKKELDRKWNEWLLKKYGSRAALDRAWTKEDGTKALAPDEDPAKGTVRRPPIGVWGERKIDYRKDYADVEGPARFADNAEFLMELEMQYIHEMKAYLRELGVKCPINVSNLPAGAAELRCVAEGDVTENNAYWNHPMGGFRVPVAFHSKEMHSTDPRNTRVGGFEMNLVTKLAWGKVVDKPFVVTEWNACYPTEFSADAMIMLSSYASLQDWDGLLLFSYSHSGGKELLTSEKMSGFFNSYNDPSMWGMAGICSAIFQNKLVDTAKNSIELCYTPLDCLATAPGFAIPYGVVPYISRISARFIEDKYQGDADMVISSGFTSTGDYRDAKHALIYARSPYADKYQKKNNREAFLQMHRSGMDSEALKYSTEGVIGEIDDRRCVLSKADVIDREYGAFSYIFDKCIKKWGLVDPSYGYQGPAGLISDNGQLLFNYDAGKFVVSAEQVVAFAGNVDGEINIRGYRMKLDNEKASVAILSRDNQPLEDSKHLLIAAIGKCYNDNMIWDGRKLLDEGTGPVVIDQITGLLYFPTMNQICEAYALDQRGNRVEKLEVVKEGNGFYVKLANKEAAIHYEVIFSN